MAQKKNLISVKVILVLRVTLTNVVVPGSKPIYIKVPASLYSIGKAHRIHAGKNYSERKYSTSTIVPYKKK